MLGSRGASQILKLVVRASCCAFDIKGARCSHYIIFWKNWDAPGLSKAQSLMGETPALLEEDSSVGNNYELLIIMNYEL